MREWFEKRKAIIIFLGVLFVVIALFLLPAFARASYESKLVGGMYFEKNFFSIFFEIVKDIFGNLKVALSTGFSYYANVFKTYLLLYFGFALIVLLKSKGSNDYSKIEHGSADWCGNKEKYSILSPKDGMILAEKTCLPVIPKPPEGKNGNILVIRRFWCR